MKKNKKPNSSRKGIAKNKKVFIISIFLFIVFISIIGITISKKEIPVYILETKYFEGELHTANHAANMIDKLNDEKNIVISPLNVNSSLAILYNGTDNNSNKEIKKYFTKQPSKVNEDITNRMDKLQEEKIKENDFTELYEEYISNLKDKSYDTLTIEKLNLMSDEDKKELVILLRRLELTYRRLVGKSEITIKEIKKYKFSSEELPTNSYTIKTLLDKTLSSYETYQIKNSVYNYHELLIDSKIEKKKIEESFITDTEKYNLSINEYDLENIEESTKEINDNVKKVTDNKVNRIVEEIDFKDNSLLLISSLYFNYEWENNFKKNQIRTEEFINSNETIGAVDMMYTTETNYLENNYARGIIKDFEGGKYSFVAILPKKTGNFKLSNLDLNGLLNTKKEKKMIVGIPKMEYQYEVNLEELLSNYGINEVFSEKANLSRITEENISIAKFTQKNTITIGEKGTVISDFAPGEFENYEVNDELSELIFNRPYAYLIMNNETEEILLIGKVVTANESN